MISVDTKKKELISNYKNRGREHHKKGQAPEVKVYDFLDKEKGKVAPYGVYIIVCPSAYPFHYKRAFASDTIPPPY